MPVSSVQNFVNFGLINGLQNESNVSSYSFYLKYFVYTCIKYIFNKTKYTIINFFILINTIGTSKFRIFKLYSNCCKNCE
jgi:hypothetical protein